MDIQNTHNARWNPPNHCYWSTASDFVAKGLAHVSSVGRGSPCKLDHCVIWNSRVVSK